jgi:hypothetical protein
MRILYHIPSAMIWAGWIVFLSSFFLPAYDGLERPGTDPGTPLLGWQAMVDSIVVLTYKFWVVLFEPGFIVFFLAPIGNAFVLFVPLFVQNLREGSWLISLPLVAISAMMWILPSEMYQHTLYGFWTWNLSILYMAFAAIVNAIAMQQYESENEIPEEQNVGPKPPTVRFKIEA